VLAGPLKAPPGRRAYLRGLLNQTDRTVTPLGNQGSHQLATLGRANSLIVVPEWVIKMAEGDEVDVMSLP
jgi:molybdopterin molybdotransferase